MDLGREHKQPTTGKGGEGCSLGVPVHRGCCAEHHTHWVAYSPGGWETQVQVPTESPPRFLAIAFLLCPHRVEGAELSGASVTGGHNPTREARPS